MVKGKKNNYEMKTKRSCLAVMLLISMTIWTQCEQQT